MAISYRFLVRGGTAANLAVVNEVPLIRELVIERDTLKCKLGDGVTSYNDLPYFTAGRINLAGLADGDVLTWNAVDEEWQPRRPKRGITITGGAIGGDVIPAAQIIGGLSASDYTLTGNWYLWCSPAGSIELDVRAAAFGSLPPNAGNSICGGNEPAVSSAISASGNFTGWSPAIARNDALSVVVNSVTDVTWFVLLLEAA